MTVVSPMSISRMQWPVFATVVALAACSDNRLPPTTGLPPDDSVPIAGEVFRVIAGNPDTVPVAGRVAVLGLGFESLDSAQFRDEQPRRAPAQLRARAMLDLFLSQAPALDSFVVSVPDLFPPGALVTLVAFAESSAAPRSAHQFLTIVDSMFSMVTTVAGDTSAEPFGGYRDGIGREAQFSVPTSLAVHSDQVYVLDARNFRIRRVHLSGEVTTLAGTGEDASRDGPIVDAAIHGSGALVVHPELGLLHSECESGRIRAVTDTAVVTLLGLAGPGFVDGAADQAQFMCPSAMAVLDDGTLLVYDAGPQVQAVRSVASDSIVQTLAGGTGVGFRDGVGAAAMFYNVADMIPLGGDSVLLVDTGNHAVRMLYVSTRAVRTITGGHSGLVDGPDHRALFFFPWGAALGRDGSILISDQGNHVIRRLSVDGRITTVAGQRYVFEPQHRDGLTYRARFWYPLDIAAVNDTLFVISDRGTIRLLSTSRNY